MVIVLLVGLGALCAASVVTVTIFSFGSAIGYRRGVADGRRSSAALPSAHTIILEEALSASRRN